MNDRMLRAGLFTSRSWLALADKERLLFVRLLFVVDDYGRFELDPVQIRNQAYPAEVDPDAREVALMLDRLAGVGLVSYYEHAGRSYLEVTKFNQTGLRRPRQRFPGPGDVPTWTPSLDGRTSAARAYKSISPMNGERNPAIAKKTVPASQEG